MENRSSSCGAPGCSPTAFHEEGRQRTLCRSIVRPPARRTPHPPREQCLALAEQIEHILDNGPGSCPYPPVTIPPAWQQAPPQRRFGRKTLACRVGRRRTCDPSSTEFNVNHDHERSRSGEPGRSGERQETASAYRPPSTAGDMARRTCRSPERWVRRFRFWLVSHARPEEPEVPARGPVPTHGIMPGEHMGRWAEPCINRGGNS